MTLENTIHSIPVKDQLYKWHLKEPQCCFDLHVYMYVLVHSNF